MYAYVALVTLLALLVYLWMSFRVGAARGKYGVPAPAITGHPEFERHFRVQSNTGEWLLLFLPSLWLFAIFINDKIAAALGLVWVAGRLLYMFSYVQDPQKRGPGFAIQGLATLALLFGSLAYVVLNLIRGAQ
jgi:glutathione S-transferase